MRMAVALEGIPTSLSATAQLALLEPAFLDAALPYWLDLPKWHLRSEYIDRSLLVEMFVHGQPGRAQTVMLRLKITALLEQLGETCIERIEQAWLYRTSTHSSWQSAGARWLRYAGERRAKRWVLLHPATFVLVNRCRESGVLSA